jgi:hypothetical protein
VLVDREAERGNGGGAAQQSSDGRKADKETKVHGSAITEWMAENENVNVDALARSRRMSSTYNTATPSSNPCYPFSSSSGGISGITNDTSLRHVAKQPHKTNLSDNT